MRHIATVLLITSATGYLPGSVPLRWTVETSRVNPASFEAYQGETLTFEATLQSYGKPIEIDPQADWNIYWQTNGMGSAYWSAPATIKASEPPSSTSTSSLHLLSATFTPSMDVGARAYNCFIGSPSNIYRGLPATAPPVSRRAPQRPAAPDAGHRLRQRPRPQPALGLRRWRRLRHQRRRKALIFTARNTVYRRRRSGFCNYARREILGSAGGLHPAALYIQPVWQ